jgi:AcrR family transcriptional regulator
MRVRIIDAARRCVGRRGYHRATLGEIAREAEVPTRTIYKHFSDRQAVINASAQAEAEAYRSVISQLSSLALASGRDPVMDLQERMLALLEKSEFFTIWRYNVEWWAAAARDPKLLEGFRQTWRAWEDILEPMVQESLGPDAPFSNRVVSTFLIVSFNGLLLHSALDHEALDFVQLRKLISHLWYLLGSEGNVPLANHQTEGG